MKVSTHTEKGKQGLTRSFAIGHTVDIVEQFTGSLCCNPHQRTYRFRTP